MTTLTRAEIKRACDILRRDDGVGPGSYVEQLSWLLFLRTFELVEQELKDLSEADGKKYIDIIESEYRWSSWANKDWKDKDELVHFINKELFPYLKSLKGTKQKEKISSIFIEMDGNKIRSPHTLLDVVDILNEIKMSDFQDTHLLSRIYEEILQDMGSEGGWGGEFYTPRPVIKMMIKMLNPKIGEKIFDPFVGSGGFLVEAFQYLLDQNPNYDVNEWETLQENTFFGQEKKPLPYLIGTMNMILHGILTPNLIRTNTLMEDVHDVSENNKYDIILTNPPFGGQEHTSVQNNYPIRTSATEGLALQYVMRHLKKGGRCAIVLPEGQILSGGGASKKIREELLTKFNVTAIISLPQGVFTQVGAGVKTDIVFFEKNGITKDIWYSSISGKFTRRNAITDEDLSDVIKSWQDNKVTDKSWLVSLSEIKNDSYNLIRNNPNSSDAEELAPPIEILKEINKNQSEINKLLSEIETLSNEIQKI